MLNAIFHNSTVPMLQEVVNFAESRHAVLAGNVANFDTPDYRIRDLSVDTFQERLKEAIAENKSPRSMGQPQGTDDPLRRVRDSLTTILRHDGADISIEHQVAEISKNQALHNTAIAIMSSQFRMLETAISERV
ncbi:flagellar basal body rod protein FlgB [Lignipirellula cremea]|uniref:Flagellar basal body rod protein FlgB n=1 Tax=Lignipirellula cremea TaxID=2528010 RepID=A0A518DQ74_9BACT|nr:flagellar basal body rod protein FlgB [Lignipirellula cremea]QDU93973.1 flagellar basal body rod protein FlgB [Lignipirellula cremea]